MRHIFNVSALKHMSNLARSDANNAMTELLQDIGSKEKPVYKFEDNSYTVTVPDVKASVEGKSIYRDITGRGFTKESALKDLFKKILSPQDRVSVRDKDAALLAIMNTKPALFARITR